MQRSIAAALLIASAAALSACGERAESKVVQKIEAVTVATTKVTKTEITVPIIATGSLTPTRQTDIGPSVDGIIEEVKAYVGQSVKKGDVLFRTRDVDYRLLVQEVEKQVALARAQLANASAELKRQNALKGGGWVSQSRMDTTKTNTEVANAQLGIWEAKLAQARQALKDTVVRAPYDGVISRKDVYEGRFMATRMGGMMGAGGTGGGGVVQIMAIEPLAAIAVAPSTYFAQLKVGMKAKVFVDGVEKPIDAKVAVINYGVDYKSRGVEVRIEVPNPGYKILPGLYCRIELAPQARPALIAERKAIHGPEGSRYAFIAQGGTAKKIAVSTRELDGERVEILSNVPEGTELLVSTGGAQLGDGVPVKVETPAAAKTNTQANL